MNRYLGCLAAAMALAISSTTLSQHTPASTDRYNVWVYRTGQFETNFQQNHCNNGICAMPTHTGDTGDDFEKLVVFSIDLTQGGPGTALAQREILLVMGELLGTNSGRFRHSSTFLSFADHSTYCDQNGNDCQGQIRGQIRTLSTFLDIPQLR